MSLQPVYVIIRKMSGQFNIKSFPKIFSIPPPPSMCPCEPLISAARSACPLIKSLPVCTGTGGLGFYDEAQLDAAVMET